MDGAYDYEDFRQTAQMRPEQQGQQVVLFGYEPVHNERKSKLAGRPIYDEIEFVRIFTPSDRDTVVHRATTPLDYQRFPREYAAWQLKQKGSATTGTPLKSWPELDRARVEELRELKLHTVEAVASMPDSFQVERVGEPPLQISVADSMELSALRQRAKDYLERASGNAPDTKMRAELEAAQAEIKELRRLLKAKQAAT